MSERPIYASLTRISDVHAGDYEVDVPPRGRWANGDYVMGEVVSPPGPLNRIELCNGRMTEVIAGDIVVGAFGTRHATLEVVGDFRLIGEDGRMLALTAAGLIGKASSTSSLLPPLLTLSYQGHLTRDGRELRMRDFTPMVEPRAYRCPTVLVIGTSMHAGKTTAAKLIIRHLKRAGLRVVGTKLTGAGRYRDIKCMDDAGADRIYDFVDVGLPSSVCPREEFEPALRDLLSLIAAEEPDVVVAEAGASPFEPYNGDLVLDHVRDSVRCTLLCSLDPYAVLGVMKGFDLRPDLVAGVATSTTAGIELIEKLTGVKALNVLEPEAGGELVAVLRRTIGY